MSYSIPPAPGRQQQVTASDLVRHFGIWQDRAARAPVYVLHRGRPRLVLTSLDIMDALCAPHAPQAQRHDPALGVVLDSIPEVALIVTAEGSVALANPAARARFGEAVAPGAALPGLALAGGEFLRDGIARVIESGIAETIEIVPHRYPARRLACDMTPLPDGCLVIARDLTTAQALLDTRAANAALTDAIAANAVVATARIGLRGYFAEPAPALARLLGVAPDALAAARFVTLADVGSRVTVGDTIETVIGDRVPRGIDARLLMRGAAPLAVRIGFSAIGQGAQIAGVQAAIARHSGP